VRAALLLFVMACDGGSHHANFDGPIGGDGGDDDAPSSIDAPPAPKPRLLSSSGGPFRSLVVAGSHVFWSTDAAIESSPTAGTPSGTPNVLTAASSAQIALANLSHVYWNVAADRVQRMAIDGSNPVELVFTPATTRSLTGTLVDWNGTIVASAIDGSNEALVALPSTSGATTLIETFASSVLGDHPAIAVAGTTLFFGTTGPGDPQIRKITSGASTLFETDAVPGVIFTDATSVYWNDPLQFALFRESIAGGPIDNVGPALYLDACVYDNSIFYKSGDNLVRLPFHASGTTPATPAADLADLGPNGEDGKVKVFACSASGVFIGVEVAGNPAPSFAVYAVQ
jgi:hypothetical protein